MTRTIRLTDPEIATIAFCFGQYLATHPTTTAKTIIARVMDKFNRAREPKRKRKK